MTDGRLDDFERRLTALEDERDIARLLASYGPLVDAGDADGAAALWATDGVYDVGDWRMAGRAEIAAMVRSDAHQGLIARGCCHFFGPPVITVTGDEAVAVCESILAVQRDSPGGSGGFAILRAGVHVVRLSRNPGEGRAGWAIDSRTARQLDGTPVAHDMIRNALAVSGDEDP